MPWAVGTVTPVMEASSPPVISLHWALILASSSENFRGSLALTPVVYSMVDLLAVTFTGNSSL